MPDQPNIQISFQTSDSQHRLTAKAKGVDGQPLSPYTLTTRVSHPDRLPAAQELLKYIYNTTQQLQFALAPDLGLAYGFWLVKLVQTRKQELEIYELNEQNDFIPGLERATKYWDAQVNLCQSQQFPFQPVNVQQTAIVNKKVISGEEKHVLGIRNIRRDDMSGWVIITEEDDLWDQENAENMYLYDIILKRPELIYFFGLPMDSAFRLDSQGYKVWSLAEEEAEEAEM
jgi:hypothetical protein